MERPPHRWPAGGQIEAAREGEALLDHRLPATGDWGRVQDAPTFGTVAHWVVVYLVLPRAREAPAIVGVARRGVKGIRARLSR
jgi:hypothetical protein